MEDQTIEEIRNEQPRQIRLYGDELTSKITICEKYSGTLHFSDYCETDYVVTKVLLECDTKLDFFVSLKQNGMTF